MILTTMTDLDRFAVLADGIAEAAAWLRGFRADVPDGRHTIRGVDVFALVSRYLTEPAAGRRFEAHRQFLDVQWVASGRERILHAPTHGLIVAEPYLAERDVVFFADPPFSSSLLLRTGDAALLFPGDAHKPGCMAGGRDEVCKVVVKVRLAG